MKPFEPELCLRVEVPICAFRPYESREYQDTHPVPPPSAIYGMLLSFLGVQREEKSRHVGVGLALAIEAEPSRSRVFRKLRRGKDLEDIRPDYQDLLIGLNLWIWIATARDQSDPSLPRAMVEALSHPETVLRSGGLSLGESSYLVDSVTRECPDEQAELTFLIPDQKGFHNLPVWIDHATNSRRRERFRFDQQPITQGRDQAWLVVGPTG